MIAGAGPVLVASDLDRTLIYSHDACGLPEGHSVDLVCVEHYDGSPLSYLTATAAALVAEIAEAAVFVPVTTRTRAQLARIQLPGPPARYAIAANGGFVLQDGQADADWTRQVTTTLAATSAPLDEIWAHLQAVFGPAFTRTLRRAEELFAYAVTERAAIPAGFVDELAAWATSRGWTTSLQGRKLYLVPGGLQKSVAVAEVARRVGARTVVAAGDSLLDTDLVLAADQAIRPAHGELADSGLTAEHLAVTASRGVLAGEEIAAWLLAACAVPTGPAPRS